MAPICASDIDAMEAGRREGDSNVSDNEHGHENSNSPRQRDKVLLEYKNMLASFKIETRAASTQDSQDEALVNLVRAALEHASPIDNTAPNLLVNLDRMHARVHDRTRWSDLILQGHGTLSSINSEIQEVIPAVMGIVREKANIIEDILKWEDPDLSPSARIESTEQGGYRDVPSVMLNIFPNHFAG